MKQTNPKGRPTSYSKNILESAREYRDNLPEDEVVHSIEGLSDYLKIARSTIYEWAKQEDKQEFSDIVSEILAKQGKTLVNKGLKGEFNSKISSVMLTKHGYREGIEHTGRDGEKLFAPSEEEQVKIDALLDAGDKNNP